MGEKARAWLAVGVWAAVIFALSSRPGPVVPFKLFPHQDKLGHFIEYCILGMLVFRTMKDVRYAPLWAILIASCYGVTDEFHQSFVANRVASITDLFADVLGAAFGQIIVTVKRKSSS